MKIRKLFTFLFLKS